MKTKVEKFNNLPREERRKIAFYRLQTQIITIAQCLSLLENAIGPFQKDKLKEWIKSLERYKYENYEEVDSCQK